MENYPLVVILLATYNGRKHLEKLLQSLERQTYSNVLVIIRDDGSQDDSLEIIKAWNPDFPTLIESNDQRLGVSGNFFRLLSKIPDSARFVAFCDQDDIWHPNKIQRAVHTLLDQPQNMPLLYCSRLHFIDKEGESLGFSAVPKKRLGFENALVQNMATGCTIMMNRALYNLVSNNPPSIPILHDRWCYIVASAFGKVFFDETPSIDYRQHLNSYTPMQPTSLFRKLNNFWGRLDAASPHSCAVELKHIFKQKLCLSKLTTLDEFIASKNSLSSRVRYSVRPGVYRQHLNVVLRLRILLNRY